jgi:hypothetical protein
VECDFFDAGEDFASSYGKGQHLQDLCKAKEKTDNSRSRGIRKLTKVVNAVFPDPLGPNNRKLLEGGEATAWKKRICRRTGTPKVNSTAIAMAIKLPSKRRVAIPVTEFQLAWLDMVG